MIDKIAKLKPLILSALLAGLQITILLIMNGELASIVASKDLAALGLIFSPTAGIIWALKADKPNSQNKDTNGE